MLIMIAAALAAPALASAAPVAVQQPNVVIAVPVADLDLANPQQVEVLNARLARLARAACEVRDPLGRSAARTDWDCVRQAEADGRRQLALRGSGMQVSAGN